MGEVAREPWHGTELHSMGFLVQADPESEVRRWHIELPLGMDDVGRDEEESTLGAERLVLAQHLG